MSIQKVLSRLGPLMVMADREHIPSFKSTIISAKAPAVRSWTDLLNGVQLTPLTSDFCASKRVIVFGEQHQQPQVLRAQLSVLSAIHEQLHQPAKIVMVLEHFNFQQDDLLRRFSEGKITNDVLLEEYSKSKEGFQLNHYLPLLLLARELGIPIYGGFPPREWASKIYKESIAALREAQADQIPDGFDESRWQQVSQISNDQIAYLKSMMSGTAPIMPDGKDLPAHGHNSGILPAQTLKDTFLAWTIDQHLKDPSTTVYAVCGLGHSEFDLCVSTRIQACSRDEICLVASKDWLSEEFIGDEPKFTNDLKLADLIVPYDAR